MVDPPEKVEGAAPRKFLPVILAGGSGVRLWPLSRPGQPKQFLPLLGGMSPFEETVTRALRLPRVDRIVVVTGEAHAEHAIAILHALSAEFTILLEPDARDSAAAVAVAAVWAERNAPGCVLAYLSSDNYIDDERDFCASLTEAAAVAGETSGLVSLGMTPSHPSPAYGYILPETRARASRVANFVEKPHEARAQALIADGALWNSGIFVSEPSPLVREFAEHAPRTYDAAVAALAAAVDEGGVMRLGPAYLDAPRISVDYAVLERTSSASVLRVAFQVCDIGSWRTLWAQSEKDASGNSASQGAILVKANDVLVRAPAGVCVAVVGVERLAVIVANGDVLVCGLDDAQLVKEAVALLHDRQAPTVPEAADPDVGAAALSADEHRPPK